MAGGHFLWKAHLSWGCHVDRSSNKHLLYLYFKAKKICAKERVNEIWQYATAPFSASGFNYNKIWLTLQLILERTGVCYRTSMLCGSSFTFFSFVKTSEPLKVPWYPPEWKREKVKLRWEKQRWTQITKSCSFLRVIQQQSHFCFIDRPPRGHYHLVHIAHKKGKLFL